MSSVSLERMEWTRDEDIMEQMERMAYQEQTEQTVLYPMEQLLVILLIGMAQPG